MSGLAQQLARSRHRRPPLATQRERMIAETSLFLTQALRSGRVYPRIPVRPVDAGGFSRILQHPGARALVVHVWRRLLRG